MRHVEKEIIEKESDRRNKRTIEGNKVGKKNKNFSFKLDHGTYIEW